jgi:hypothetical protein
MAPTARVSALMTKTSHFIGSSRLARYAQTGPCLLGYREAPTRFRPARVCITADLVSTARWSEHQDAARPLRRCRRAGGGQVCRQALAHQRIFSGRTNQSFDIAFLCRGKGLN